MLQRWFSRQRATGERLRPALEFEAVLAKRAHQSEKTAWWVAAAAFVVALIALGTLLALLPLKQTVPYLIYLDKATGITQVVDVATPSRITQDQMNARHWVRQHVLARERYVYKLLQEDYEFVMATASSEQQKAYGKQFEPGPRKKDAVLRDQVEERIKILSVHLSASQSGKATVRLSKETWHAGAVSAEKVESWIADVAYDWVGVKGWDEQSLLINPLGFRVLAYRLTLETLK